MTRLRPSDRAWIALGAGVLAWDLLCPHGEMLSEASARYTAGRPALSRLLIGYVAVHLMHLLPARCDPLSRLAEIVGR